MFRPAESGRNGYKYHDNSALTPSSPTSFPIPKITALLANGFVRLFLQKHTHHRCIFGPNQTSLSAQKPFFLAGPSKKRSPMFDVSFRSRLQCELSKRPFQQIMASKLMAARTIPSSVCDIKNGLAVFDVCSRPEPWGIKHSSRPSKPFLPISHSTEHIFRNSNLIWPCSSLRSVQSSTRHPLWRSRPSKIQRYSVI